MSLNFIISFHGIDGNKGNNLPADNLSIVLTLSPMNINFMQIPSKKVLSGVNRKSFADFICEVRDCITWIESSIMFTSSSIR